MNLSFFRLGLRTLVRDLRAGELRLLMVAVTLAVAALTSVGFFADRLQGGLQRDALQLLGGDAVVASDNPTPAAFVERAKSLGLQIVRTLIVDDMGGTFTLINDQGTHARITIPRKLEEEAEG